MEEELTAIVEKINGCDKLNADEIGIELIENRGNQQSKLIFNGEENFSIKLENREYKFKFKEPIYIDRIQLKAKSSLKDVVITYKTIQQILEKRTIKEDKSSYIASRIRNTIDEFSIQAPKKSRIELEKIELFGFRLSQFEIIKDNFNQILSLNDKLEKGIEEANVQILKMQEESAALDGKHQELDEKVEELSVQKNELEQTISDAQKKANGLKNSQTQLDETIKKLNSTELNLKNSIQEREATLTTVNTNISARREELKKLESDKSLIAYDVQDYIKNANENIYSYKLLSLMPWAIIFIATMYILFGTDGLTTVLKVEQDAQIWTIFWTRIPFVLAVSSVIYVAYEVSNVFIRKIIEINQQKLDFQKLGIIAKDVSEVSSMGLELSDEEKFELRTKLKMDMLKSHLSKDLGKNFEINIKPHIWQRFLNKKNKDTEIDEEQNNNMED